MGCVLCEHCTGECCRYVAVPLEKPKTHRDFEDIRWYLLHDGITVFVEDGTWYIQFRTTCRHLRSDFKCGIYETRPTICREYKAGDCDYSGGDYDYDHLFTEPDQIAAFGREFLAKKRKKATTSRRRNGPSARMVGRAASPAARVGR